MKPTYNLICMTFDGDYVTEKRGFDTVLDAWEHANDLGSKWFFYPFCFVTSASGLTIADSPEWLEQFKGKRVKTVSKRFEQVSILPEAQGADCDEFCILLMP